MNWRPWGITVLGISLAAAPLASGKTNTAKAGRRPTAAQEAPAPAPPPPPPPAPAKKPNLVKEEVNPDTRFYSSKLNTFLGIHLLKTSAFSVGAQYGIALGNEAPFYVGPEVSFSLFSPGNILMALASAWHEVRVFGSPRLAVSIGGLAGGAFTSGLIGFGGTTYAAFLDATLSQDVDDLVSVRGQFRPGVIGGNFAFMMNLSISFRFL